MCAYCVMADWGRDWLHPRPVPYPVPLPYPVPQPPPAGVWTQEMLDQFRNLIERVKKMEERLMQLGEQVECVEAPEKMHYLDEIQKLLDRARAEEAP
jgi:acetyl esterase/lipase